MQRKSPNHSLGRPICYLCHRPFDPSSPGATSIMGPTCAKRAGKMPAHSNQMSLDQLPSNDEEIAQSITLSPRLLGQKESAKARWRAPRARRVPSALYEKYIYAKYAFDELLREFGAQGSLYFGQKAVTLYEQLILTDAVVHSFQDPNLNWLEPEFQLKLIEVQTTEGVKTFYWRVLNSTATLLETHAGHSAQARKNIEAIREFSLALRQLREREVDAQLCLPELS